jgi:hypothetical protein
LTRIELGDAPLSEPAQDLLDMASNARALAKFVDKVKLPFTIGIYGSWGEGKTSFAQFFLHYLADLPDWHEVQVIKFSAWPYVTADAIWRALLDKIARQVYLGTNSLDPENKEASASTLRERIHRFMQAEVLTLRAASASSRREQYERLRKRFDRSAMLANRTFGEPSANVSALASLVLEAAATMTPGVGPIRRLLGIGDASVRSIASGDQATVHYVVESVEELRDDLRQLFTDMAENTAKLVILIDDLDRCMPQVALDFLETVKVFFFESAGVEAKCLFLVAVDEDLIGRGLRIRIGDTPNMNAEEEARMYLEKIVQLRAPVPSSDAGRVHQLVSAGFPEWTLTTDIIDVGLGRNPRRVKQQCCLMSYGFQARGLTE